MTKMTKRERFEAMCAFLAAAPANMDATPEGQDPEAFLADCIDFCLGEIVLIERKRAGAKGMTKEQRINVGVKQEIVRFLNTVDAATATQVGKALEISPQKATALLKQLKDDKVIVRDATGKNILFAVNED